MSNNEESADISKEKPKNKKVTFLTVVVVICAYTPFLAVLAYFLAKIIYASLHIHECPHSPMVPIAVIISGCIPFFGFLAYFLGHRVKAKAEMKGERKALDRYITLALFLVMLLWIIIESPFVFIENSHEPSVPSNSTEVECSKDILQFAFVTIIIDWVCIGGGFIVFLLCWCTLDIVRKLCHDSHI